MLTVYVYNTLHTALWLHESDMPGFQATTSAAFRVSMGLNGNMLFYWITEYHFVYLYYYNYYLLCHTPYTRGQGCQSGLKSGGVTGLGFKTGDVVGPHMSTEAHSTGLRVSTTEILNWIIYKSSYFWKVTTLNIVLISYSCTIVHYRIWYFMKIIIFSVETTTPIPKSGDQDLQTPRIDA